jgi:hypothetical protein
LITLEVVEGSSRGTVFECAEPIITLGRAHENRIPLSDYHAAAT